MNIALARVVLFNEIVDVLKGVSEIFSLTKDRSAVSDSNFAESSDRMVTRWLDVSTVDAVAESEAASSSRHADLDVERGVMPALLGKTISQATIDRIVAAFNDGVTPGQEQTATQIQTRLRQQVINKVKKYEDRVAAESVTPSDFDLVER